MKGLLFGFIITTCSALLLSGCSRSNEGGSTETATQGTFELVADEALRPALDSLAIGFMKENPKSKVTIKYEDAGQAVEDLLNEKARIVIIARGLAGLERNVLKKYNLTLPEFEIAKDAVGVIVSRDNPLNSISMTDIRKVLRNEAKNFSDLKTSEEEGGKLPNVPITRILPPQYSSTEFLLDSLFLDSNTLQIGKLQRFSTTDSIFAAVRQNSGAIGFVTSAWRNRYDRANDSSYKVLEIIPDSGSKAASHSIMMHMAYVYQGIYPLVSRVVGYTFEQANSTPRGFLAYAMNAQGQRVFLNHDILPGTQIIRIVPSK